MRKQTSLILYWSLGFIASFLFIWGVAAVFKTSVTPKVWDEKVGRYVNDPDTVIRNRSEGWADTKSASHGLSPEGERIFYSSVPKFLYWGDSFADGIQVAAEDRAVNRYNAMSLQLAPKGVSVADSGLSVADFYFYIPRYEQLTENVVGHVFLLPGFRSITPGRHLDCHSQFLPDPWRFEYSDCEPSEEALKYASVLNRSRTDFIHALYRSIVDYSLRFSVGNMSVERPVVQKASAEPSLAELKEAWTFLLAELKKKTTARLVFLYMPLRPSLAGGEILFEAEATKVQKELFMQLCREADVDFIDLAPDFNRLYEEEGRLGMGFFNTPQGTGHLNEDGQALVAKGLYEYFSKGVR